jgi:GT2 family glycosyltransferase
VESFRCGLITYDHDPGRSPSAPRARNRAIELARGEYVATVDDDCEMPPEWVEAVRAELEHRAYPDVLYGEVRHPESNPDPKTVAASIFVPEGIREWSYPVDPARLGFSGHMIIRRSAFLAVGGFDERLGPGSVGLAAEDMDLNYRLLKASRRAVTSPSIWLVHHQSRSQDELPCHLFRHNHGQAAFCVKHLRQGDRFVWRVLARQVLHDARMLASAGRRRSWIKARAAGWRALGTWVGFIRGWRIFAGEK